jgi:hypothetical protein
VSIYTVFENRIFKGINDADLPIMYEGMGSVEQLAKRLIHARNVDSILILWKLPPGWRIWQCKNQHARIGTFLRNLENQTAPEAKGAYQIKSLLWFIQDRAKYTYALIEMSAYTVVYSVSGEYEVYEALLDTNGTNQRLRWNGTDLEVLEDWYLDGADILVDDE